MRRTNGHWAALCVLAAMVGCSSSGDAGGGDGTDSAAPTDTAIATDTATGADTATSDTATSDTATSDTATSDTATTETATDTAVTEGGDAGCGVTEPEKINVKAWPTGSIPADAKVQPNFCGLAAVAASPKPTIEVPVSTAVTFTGTGTGFYDSDTIEEKWPPGTSAGPDLNMVAKITYVDPLIAGRDASKTTIIVGVAPPTPGDPCTGAGYVVTAERGTVKYMNSGGNGIDATATSTVAGSAKNTGFVVLNADPGAPITISSGAGGGGCTLKFSPAASFDALSTNRFPAFAGHVSYFVMYQRP